MEQPPTSNGNLRRENRYCKRSKHFRASEPIDKEKQEPRVYRQEETKTEKYTYRAPSIKRNKSREVPSPEFTDKEKQELQQLETTTDAANRLLFLRLSGCLEHSSSSVIQSDIKKEKTPQAERNSESSELTDKEKQERWRLTKETDGEQGWLHKATLHLRA